MVSAQEGGEKSRKELHSGSNSAQRAREGWCSNLRKAAGMERRGEPLPVGVPSVQICAPKLGLFVNHVLDFFLH